MPAEGTAVPAAALWGCSRVALQFLRAAVWWVLLGEESVSLPLRTKRMGLSFRKGQWVPAAQGEASTQGKKEFFTVRTISHRNNLPRDMVESPALRVSGCDWTVCIIYDNIMYAPFPMKSWTRWFLRSLPTWAVLCFCEFNFATVKEQKFY